MYSLLDKDTIEMGANYSENKKRIPSYIYGEEIVNAILYKLKTEMQWNQVPVSAHFEKVSQLVSCLSLLPEVTPPQILEGLLDIVQPSEHPMKFFKNMRFNLPLAEKMDLGPFLTSFSPKAGSGSSQETSI